MLSTISRRVFTNVRARCLHLAKRHTKLQNKTVSAINKTKFFHKIEHSFHTSVRCHEVVAFNLSDIGEGIKEVVLKEWFVEIGDEVSQFDSICEVQSDKASVTITSRYDGIIRKLHADIEDIVQVGNPLVDIESTDSASIEADDVDEEVVMDEEREEIPAIQKLPIASGNALATPSVRHLAKTNNIDINDVKGSGDNGRVLESDIHKLMGKEKTPTPTHTPKKPVDASHLTTEPIKGIRKVMLNSMTKANQIPHFGYNDEYDVTKLVIVRKELKRAAKEHDIKLSYMPFILKAVSVALEKYPILNSSLDDKLENIIYKPRHNICIAVDSPHGLLLPCVKDVQEKSILEVAAEIIRLQEAGLKNKLQPQDLADGTFSLSNIGSIGGTYAHPVIFPPQVAIGAIGKIQEVPRFDYDGNIKRASVICLSWSADHRIIEGATMARFSNMVKDLLENPSGMLLHLK